MASGWKGTIVWLVIFAAVLAAVLWFVRERERSCAESCSANGYAAYEYKGFSGSGRYSLRPDACTCTNAGASPAAPAK